MTYRVRIFQRVGIDLDDEHGQHAGDGAALVELAELWLDLKLPFAPFRGLLVDHEGTRIELDEVVWDHAREVFECSAATVWMQTKPGAEGIVAELIEAGFRPLEPDHRNEKDVH